MSRRLAPQTAPPTEDTTGLLEASLQAAVAEWRSSLTAERRSSSHTVESYGRDRQDVNDFLGDRAGDRVGLAGFDSPPPSVLPPPFSPLPGSSSSLSSLPVLLFLPCTFPFLFALSLVALLSSE